MTLKIQRGDSPAIAKVLQITPSNVSIGDPFTLSVNGKPVTYVAAAATAADVVAGLAAAIAVAAATIPEYTEFTAAASGGNLVLTAATPGVPFFITASTSSALGAGVTVTETTPGKFPVNEVHQISLVGTYTGGTFTISQPVPGNGTQTTGNIAWNATAATVQAALAALTGVGVGQVIVTGGPGPASPWFVQWTGTLGGQAIMVGTINGANLTGNGGVSIVETQLGNGLSDDIQFLDGSVCHTQQILNFTLSLDGQTTSVLATNMSAASIQTALQALPNIGSGNVLVYSANQQNGEPSTWAIHFTGAMAGIHVNQLVVGGWSATQLPPTITTLQNGGLTSSDDFQWIDLGMAAGGVGAGGTVVSYTVTYGGKTTIVLSNTNNGGQDQAATLKTALQALSSIGANNCNVYGPADTFMTGQVTNGFLVRLTGAKANTRGSNFTVTCGAGAPTVTRISNGLANVNEVQNVTIFGTGGTFTLTLAGQTTAATAWNAAAATLQANIIAAFTNSVTAVTVSGAGTIASPYVVTFTNVGNKAYALMTGSGAALTGGGGTDVEQTAGAAGVSEVQTVTLAAGVTGGTFTLAFNGAVTVPIAWNASAATMQTNLQALSTINTATAAGSAGGPWTVTWSGAQANAPEALLVANGSQLQGPAGSLTLTTLTFSSGPRHYDDPLNWLPAGVPNSGDSVSFEQGGADCSFGLNQISTFTWSTGPNQGTFTGQGADLQNGQSVYLTTTNTLPAGLAVNTLYYLVNVSRDAQTFQLSATLGGAAITVTTTGTGVHTVGVRLASLDVNSRWSGSPGLPQQNPLGYFEYRPTYLHVGMATVAQIGAPALQSVTVGDGQGSGGAFCQIDTDVDLVNVTVVNSGGGTQPGVPPMLWKGQNASSTLTVLNGSVGAALFPNETALLAAITGRGGTVELGPGVTVSGPVVFTAGQLKSDGATLNGSVILR